MCLFVCFFVVAGFCVGFCFIVELRAPFFPFFLHFAHSGGQRLKPQIDQVAASLAIYQQQQNKRFKIEVHFTSNPSAFFKLNRSPNCKSCYVQWRARQATERVRYVILVCRYQRCAVVPKRSAPCYANRWLSLMSSLTIAFLELAVKSRHTNLPHACETSARDEQRYGLFFCWPSPDLIVSNASWPETSSVLGIETEIWSWWWLLSNEFLLFCVFFGIEDTLEFSEIWRSGRGDKFSLSLSLSRCKMFNMHEFSRVLMMPKMKVFILFVSMSVMSWSSQSLNPENCRWRGGRRRTAAAQTKDDSTRIASPGTHSRDFPFFTLTEKRWRFSYNNNFKASNLSNCKNNRCNFSSRCCRKAMQHKSL